jgi:anti-sigma factor (TIGR02949 family)
MEPENDPCASPRAGVDCEEAVHRLYHYLDGELTPDRREVIRLHLDACHHCLEAFEFEFVLRRTIANRCREEVPPALIARVAAAIAHESGTRSPPPTFT